MGKYMLRANYTQAGLQGLMKEGGTGRRAALAQAVEGPEGSWRRSTMCWATGTC